MYGLMAVKRGEVHHPKGRGLRASHRRELRCFAFISSTWLPTSHFFDSTRLRSARDHSLLPWSRDASRASFLRQSLGISPETQHYVTTIPIRGINFAALARSRSADVCVVHVAEHFFESPRHHRHRGMAEQSAGAVRERAQPCVSNTTRGRSASVHCWPHRFAPRCSLHSCGCTHDVGNTWVCVAGARDVQEIRINKIKLDIESWAMQPTCFLERASRWHHGKDKLWDLRGMFGRFQKTGGDVGRSSATGG